MLGLHVRLGKESGRGKLGGLGLQREDLRHGLLLY